MQTRAAIVQQETGRPVRFELTEQTRAALQTWIDATNLTASDHLFPSRVESGQHISNRQYARIVKSRVSSIGLEYAK